MGHIGVPVRFSAGIRSDRQHRRRTRIKECGGESHKWRQGKIQGG